MLTHRFRQLVLTLAIIINIIAGSAIAFAGDLEVTVLDQNQENIKNAVVMLYANEGQQINFTPPYPEVMAQRDVAFAPHVLAIYIGSEVAFPNQDETRHHVYSFSEARVLELRLYEGGAVRTVDFPNAGVVVLGCNIHDSMLGYIYVSDTPIFLKSNEVGKAHFKDLPEGEYRMRIWHPRLHGNMEDMEKTIVVSAEGTQIISHDLRLKRERRSRSAY